MEALEASMTPAVVTARHASDDPYRIVGTGPPG